VDPVPDPLLLRKCGSATNRTRDLCVSSQELRLLDHRGGRQLVRSNFIPVSVASSGLFDNAVCLFSFSMSSAASRKVSGLFLSEATELSFSIYLPAAL
jgi:hypothetical protein